MTDDDIIAEVENRIRSREAAGRLCGFPTGYYEPTVPPKLRRPLGELLAPGGERLLTEAAEPERERAWKAAMEELERIGETVWQEEYPWHLPADDGTIP